MKYRNYNDSATYSLEDFIKVRSAMVAPLIGGASDVAIDYTFSVKDDGENFRNPTVAEREDFKEALWKYRARDMDCRNGCELRGRFDGAWRCMSCNAVWTHPDLGHTYGVPLTSDEAAKEIRALRAESAALYTRYTVSSRADLRDALEAINEYGTRQARGDQSTLVMDVQLVNDMFPRFLIVRGQEGVLSVAWETSQTLRGYSFAAAGA